MISGKLVVFSVFTLVYLNALLPDPFFTATPFPVLFLSTWILLSLTWPSWEVKGTLLYFFFQVFEIKWENQAKEKWFPG